jgi:maltooligosyltrehalose trehalohydrolase
VRERFAQRARAGRGPLLIAEDHRNLAAMLRSESDGGFGLDAVWADDFHHQVRRALAGDHEGYYADYSGSMADLCATLRRGWFFRGQPSPTSGGSRGTDPAGLSPRRFVICLQNHDQVGNRAFGDRLHHAIDLPSYRAASTLLLCAPETPLLFMGQEWAATTPFLFFTDHKPEIGKMVTRGRRHEFAQFSAFRDPAVRASIPDPQAATTFASSVLAWPEVEREPHASLLRLYRALLRLRREEPALAGAGWEGVDAVPVEERGLVLTRATPGARPIAIAVHLRGGGAIDIPGNGGREWRPLLDTEEPRFSTDPLPIRVEARGASTRVTFARPGAVLLAAGGR